MSPPDLNQPITNTDLLAALDALTQADTPAARQLVATQMQAANYLVAILTDELRTTPGDAPNQVTLQAGSKFGVLTCDDGQGGQVLPLFTDWEALRHWTTRPVSTLVLPAAEAWQFALAGGTYASLVINPADQGIFLAREALARLVPG